MLSEFNKTDMAHPHQMIHLNLDSLFTKALMNIYWHECYSPSDKLSEPTESNIIYHIYQTLLEFNRTNIAHPHQMICLNLEGLSI